MDLLLSIPISSHGPLSGFVCADPGFTIIFALIRPIICDDLSSMTPWCPGNAPSCCDCCCSSHNKGFVPRIVDNLFVSPNSFESWGVDDIESTVNMEHICFIVDCNVEFIEDVGDVICRQIELS